MRSRSVAARREARRRPLVERSLVRRVRLGEAERGVQRERELEEHERARLTLASPLEQRQERAVVLDRLVERVLLPRLVAGAQEVVGGLLLVLRCEPVMREQAEHLGLASRVPLLEPFRRSPVQLVRAWRRGACGTRSPGSARGGSDTRAAATGGSAGSVRAAAAHGARRRSRRRRARRRAGGARSAVRAPRRR